MRKKVVVTFCLIYVFAFTAGICAGGSNEADAKAITDKVVTDVVNITIEQQYEAVRPGGKSALAVHFELKEGWHFYASAKTAPGQMNLKVTTITEADVKFSDIVFPPPHLYFDESSGQKLEVFSGKFTAFLPFSAAGETEKVNVPVKVVIEGAACSGTQCRMVDVKGLGTTIKIAANAAMSSAKFALPDSGKAMRSSLSGYSGWFALLLAFVAGLSLNIMPCVWPILPIVVMRIVEQAKKEKSRSAAMGLLFCLGILLFFACLAGANIVLQVFYGTVLQWGDQFRNPVFVGGMALLLVVLALFMFGVFTIGVPASIADKSDVGGGYSGAVGMGFLAAVLSTPCSFGILAAAFAWAQAQPLLPATIVIIVIGVGMALPYAVLTSMPGLLNRLPRAGRWMELFKQTVGFILLLIAVKLIAALPEVRRIDVLYFALVLSFCVWMWSGWVGYDTKKSHKWLIRVIAVVLAVAAGWVFLPAPAAEPVDWQPYNSALIDGALSKGRPVLIKFTAEWCLNCKVVDRNVYHRRDIANLIKAKKVLAIRADTTLKDYPATYALKSVYNEPAVPVNMLFVPGEKEPVRWHGMFFADELKALLEKLPDSK